MRITNKLTIRIVTVAVLLCIITIAFVGCNSDDKPLSDGHSYREGLYLRGDSGQNVIIIDAEGANPAYPCSMTAENDGVMFDALTDGDRIKIEISFIAESYPAQTQVYSVVKLSDDKRSDIDAEILASLAELGWIGKAETESTSISIYRCDDVYRDENTKTYGSASVIIPTFPNDYMVSNCQILLCDDGCDPTDVVSRAYWGYAPAYRIDKYTEFTAADGWSFTARKYQDTVPAEIAAEMQKQGAPENVISPRKYLYLLTLDDTHYAFIVIEPKSNDGEKPEKEESAVNEIIKAVRIELSADDKGSADGNDSAVFTSDIENYIPPEASSAPEITVLEAGKLLLEYDSDDKLPRVYYAQCIDAESFIVMKTEFPMSEELDGAAFDSAEMIDVLYANNSDLYVTLRFTKSNGALADVRYYGCPQLHTANTGKRTDMDFTWDLLSVEEASERNLARGKFDAMETGSRKPGESAQVLFYMKTHPACYYFCAIRTLNALGNAYTDDPPKDFAVYYRNYTDTLWLWLDAPIPVEYKYDSVTPVVAFTDFGANALLFVLRLTDGDRIYYIQYAAYEGIPEVYHPVSDDELSELAKIFPEAFGDSATTGSFSSYVRENSDDSLIYEGYTAALGFTSSMYKNKEFDFHIHLPQLNSRVKSADEWNTLLADKYYERYGKFLSETENGENDSYTVNVTYNTVMTGDVITVYIINYAGYIGTGAATVYYDIYHYDTVKDKMLTTEEFLAYYAEGQFAGYKVADIAVFMNELKFSVDEAGKPYTLTEKDIQGVIPSVFGGGKFDVVYQDYYVEGQFASRVLFSPYPTHTTMSKVNKVFTNYTYRLVYSDVVICEDKLKYGNPVGYELFIGQNSEEAGVSYAHSPDFLLTEDIGDAPAGYTGKYYTPIEFDEQSGLMYLRIDADTDIGHLNVMIPFDMLKANDYYRGVSNGWISYEHLISMYEFASDIADKVAEIFDAYRAGKDPNLLLPASLTEFTAYPLEKIRENPKADELREILKTANVTESGQILLTLDLSDGWVMTLPINIGLFGDSYDTYFSGIYFAHATPKA